MIRGAPGVGKSALALHYARVHAGEYPGGTFRIGLSGGGPPIDLAQLARTVLAGPEAAGLSVDDQCHIALSRIGPGRTLIVFDGAADEKGLVPWLPPAGMPCDVLVTTNWEDWGPRFAHVDLDPMPDDEARVLVCALAGQDFASRYADRIVSVAGGLPVQICPVTLLLAKRVRRGRPTAAIAEALSSETRQSFSSVWNVLDRDARLVLKIAALFDDQRIPAAIVEDELATSGELTAAAVSTAIDACLDNQVLERSGGDLRMHQLFASFVRGESVADPVIADPIRDVHLNRFIQVAQRLHAAPADTELAATFLSFSLSPDAWSVDTRRPLPAWFHPLVGSALTEIGRFDQALPWFRFSVAQAEKRPLHEGPVDHSRQAVSLNGVGLCLSETGKYEEARVWYERAVQEATQGDVHGRVDHETVGISLHDVGICLSEIGKCDEARGWFERAIKEKKLGNIFGAIDRESLGRSLHSVGTCLLRTGKYEEALGWYERAAEEKKLGNIFGAMDRNSVARTLRDGACCLAALGMADCAAAWEREAAALDEGALPDARP